MVACHTLAHTLLQIEAIKSLNSLINKTKGVMQATKKSYEAAVQARNATGGQQQQPGQIFGT